MPHSDLLLRGVPHALVAKLSDGYHISMQRLLERACLMPRDVGKHCDWHVGAAAQENGFSYWQIPRQGPI